MCKHFVAGTCKRGSSCTFRHSTKPSLAKKKKVVVPAPAPAPAPGPGPGPGPGPAPAVSTNLWGFEEEEENSGAYFYGAAGTVLEKRQVQQAVSYKAFVAKQRGSRAPLADNRDREECEENPQALIMDDIWSLAREANYLPELECGICMTSPAKKFQAYGLLNNCNCVFCLGCIKSWRRTDGQKQDTTRACPLCRTLSYYIVPSFLTFAISSNSPGGDEEARMEISRRLQEAKERTLELYLQAQKQKVCRYFKNDGFCQFGSSCQFRHIGADGTEVQGSKPRFLMGADYVAPPFVEEGETPPSTEVEGLVVLGERTTNSLADYLEKGNKGKR